MNDVLTDFLVWLACFLGTSATTLVVVHLLSKRWKAVGATTKLASRRRSHPDTADSSA